MYNLRKIFIGLFRYDYLSTTEQTV